MLRILYYPEGRGGPVAAHLQRLSQERPKAAARLSIDLEILKTEGSRSPRITVASFGGKLLELKRLYDGIQYRMFFVIWKGEAWLLHSIEKKSAKTPAGDLKIAYARLKEVTRR